MSKSELLRKRPMSRVWTPSAGTAPGPETKLRPYTGVMLPLRKEDSEFFRRRYEIPIWAAVAVGNIQRAGDGLYLLPIYSPSRARRGVVARVPWPGAPLWATWPDGPKARTYRSMWGPVQSHYPGSSSDEGPLVVVEDQLSAIKLASQGYDSVALLGTPADVVGTYGGSDRVAELATRARTHDEVIIALDEDATEAAFVFVRKWGSAFRRIRVAILSKDLKDTPANEFEEVLGV